MATHSDEPHANPNGTDDVTPAVTILPADGTGTQDQPPQIERSHERVRLLDTFKTNLAHAGLYRPATDGARASHDDATLMYVCPPSLCQVSTLKYI
jgi:hypothetical protein